MNKISCKFKYECPKRWDDLDATTTDDVKFCSHCEQEVYLVQNQAEFEEQAKNGHCIAIETLEFAMAGMPDGESFVEYSILIFEQEITGKKLFALRDLVSSDMATKISLSDLRATYHKTEVLFREGISQQDAIGLKEKLDSISILCEIQSEQLS